MRTVLLEIYCIHLLLKTSNVLFLSTMYCFKPTVGNSFSLFLLLLCTMHCFYYYDDPHAKCTVLLTGLTHTLLQRTLYSKGTLCIVTSCSKEQFASNWLVTVCFLTHFTPQHTLPTGIFFFLEHFTPQPPLLPRTLFSSAQFASQHPLLLITSCSSAQFAAQHTLLLSTLCSSVHFTP